MSSSVILTIIAIISVVPTSYYNFLSIEFVASFYKFVLQSHRSTGIAMRMRRSRLFSSSSSPSPTFILENTLCNVHYMTINKKDLQI